MTDAPPLDRLTPAVAAEVRRNLLVTAGLMAALAAVLAGVFVPFLPAAGTAVVLASVAVFLLTVLAVSVLAGYLAGGWLGLLRTSFVCRTWGVDPAALSNAALRRRTRERGYWLATLRGAAVGAAALATVGLLWWAATGRVIAVGAWTMVLIGPLLVSARSYAVRRAVAETTAATAPAVP